MIKNLEGSSSKSYISFSSGKTKVIAKSDINGKICLTVEEQKTYDEFYWKIINKLFVIVCLVIEMFFIKNCKIVSNIVYSLAIVVYLFSLYHLYNISRRSFRNHAAEHMMINAYNSIKRVPTIEEAKKFSRFSLNCGDRKYVINFICIVINIVFKFNIPYFALSMAISNLKIIKIIALPIQFFSTNVPSDSNLTLAREALKKLEEITK